MMRRKVWRKGAFLLLGALSIGGLLVTGGLNAKAASVSPFAKDNAVVEENVKVEESEKLSIHTAEEELVTSGICGENVSWSYAAGVLTISGTGDMTDYNYGNRAEWMGDGYDITDLVVESGVTSIGDYAFTGCITMRSITVADSVKRLGYAAFADCVRLDSFQGGEGLVELEDYVFQSAPIKSFQIGEKLTKLAETAFFWAGIQEFAVVEGNEVFTEVDGIVYTDASKTLFAYPEAKAGTSFEIPNTVTKLGRLAFQNNDELEEITIPDSVTVIGESAFQGCNGLKSVHIPDSVTELGYFAFYGCGGLEELKLGKGVEQVPYEFASGCTKLTTLDLGAVKRIDNRAFVECSALEELVIPNTVEQIGVAAFYDCKKLSKVTFGEGLQNILTLAFSGCDLLEQVNIPKSVMMVGEKAFPENTALEVQNRELIGNNTDGYFCLQKVSVTGDEYYDAAFRVLELVNQERAKAGLTPLYMDASLLDTAMLRAAETSVYFSHTRPSGKDCFTANELMYGENIAAGSTTAEDVMEQWMNSPGHKANILSNYTSVGIGCFKAGPVYFWVQCFGKNEIASDCSQPENKSLSQPLELSPTKFQDSFWVRLDKSNITEGAGTAKASLYVNNPEWTYVSTALDSGVGFEWVSSDTEIAMVDENGVVTGVSDGTATISAKLDYYESMGADVTVSGVNPFGDVEPEAWYYPYAKYAWKHGIMTGKDTSEEGLVIFAPEDTLTRAEFVQILYSAEGKPKITYNETFADVPEGEWYTSAVLWAAEQGIVSGYDNGNYGTFDKITREQLALMLYRYAEYKKYDTTARVEVSDFADAEEISPWAKEQIRWAVANGIMSGNGDGLDPAGDATRAECATMMKAFLTKY